MKIFNAHRTMAGLVVISVATAFLVASCGSNSAFTEEYQDANVGTRNDAPADIITMPDAFANIATKCDNGNRIYVVRDAGSQGGRGGLAVVPNDPTCK